MFPEEEFQIVAPLFVCPPEDVSDMHAAIVLPEASFPRREAVENNLAGLGRCLDNIISDAAACCNCNATQQGRRCWRLARSISAWFAAAALPFPAALHRNFRRVPMEL